MNESKKHFVDKLLAADAPSLDARGRYEKEVAIMLQMSLTPRQRGAYLAGAMILLLPLAMFLLLGLFTDPNTPSDPAPAPELLAFLKVYFAVTGLVLTFVACLLFWGYWQGVVNRRTVHNWATGIGVAYVGLVGWLFMLVARHIPEMFRDDLRVFGLILLVYAAVAWVRHQVGQAEMRTAEKLLEIELRLAQITEQLPGRSVPPTSV